MTSRVLSGVLRYIRPLAGAEGSGDRRDAELLAEFVTRRDEGAFAVLLERHGPLVLGVCRQTLGDAHDAEDAFQATFLVLARRAASIRQHESLAAWLHRVAVNVSRTARLMNTRRRAHERKAVVMVAATPAVDETVCDWQPILHEEVDRLPEKYRVPVMLCYLEGKTHDQAAQQLGWPLGTVKGRLARARDLLRMRLERRGLALPAAGLAAVLAESASAAAVPPRLLALTLRAAVTFAAGGAGAGSASSAAALALAKATLQTTLATKLLSVAALLLAVGLTAFALAPGRQAESPFGSHAKAPEAERNVKPDQPKAPVRAVADLHGDPLPPGALARLGTVRFRIPEGWPFLAFLPGDKTLMTAGGALSTWDISTGRELRRWDSRNGSGSFALAPDGRSLAVGTYTDNPNTVAIYLRDATTGRVLQECRGHSSWVRSLAWAPDGRTLISGSHDRTVRFWNMASGKELRRFDEADMVMAVALSPDGKTLATTSFHSPNAKWNVRLRDAATGKEKRRFQANVPVFRLAFSPDGRTLVALAPHNGGQPTSTIYLWDMATGKFREIAGQPPFMYSAVFTPDSKTLATGSDQGIVLWDVTTAKARARLGGRHAWTTCLAFSRDGKLLATVSHGTVRLWDVATGKERPPPAEGHQGGIGALVFLPDGKTLASVGRDMTLRFWKAVNGRPTRHHRLPAGTFHSYEWFADDGSTLAWRDGKRIGQLDVKTGKPLRSFDLPEIVYFFAMAPAGKLLAAYSRDRTLRLLDRTSGKVVRVFARYPELVSGLAFAPDGRTLAVAVEDSTIRLEDPATGKQRLLLQWPTGIVAFVFSPDSRTLSVSLADNRLVLVDVATGKELRAIRLAEHAAKLVYSPNGKLLAVGTSAGAIHLWEPATGKMVSKVKGHRGGVSCLAFSADGRRLASGGDDTTVLIWDVLNLGGEPPPGGNLSPKELKALWANLAGPDIASAYRAMRGLTAAPEQAVPFLGEQLRPAPAPAPKRLARLIADLDDDLFAVRENATRELEKLGLPTRPALKKALDGKPSPEVRRRVEGLLRRLEQLMLTPDDLRSGRAIAVLEWIGTDKVREILERLVRQESDPSLAGDARAALKRLRRRPARP
jgi:RNA polymerase sigma factor (sigma-70 family)